MARLRPGVSLAAAQAEVDSIEKGLRAALPEFHTTDVRVVPLREHFTGDVQKPLLILFGAVAFLLLIACTNVANLLLARAAQRERELAIRTALGAGPARLLRQLITEALVLSCAAGAAGIASAFALVPLLKALSPADTPLLNAVTMNQRGLMFAVTVSLILGALLGIAPGLQLARRKINESVNSSGRSSTESRRSRRWKNALVVAEFALATILLTGAGLLIRSFVAVLHVDLGFHSERVLTIQIGVPRETSPSQAAQFYREIMQRISGLPGVQAVGGASSLFFLDEKRTHALRQVEGHPPEPPALWKPLVWTQIAGNYFQAMGISLLRGRFFNERDRPSSPPVAIINETLARRYWPHENPIGRRLKGFDPRGQHDDWLTVVGVVKDMRSGGLEKAPFSQIYEVQAQRGEQLGNLVVRTSSNPAAIAGAVRRVIHTANHAAIVSSVRTMEELLDLQEMQRRFQTWLISVFAGLALALAALGVFAIMHYSVAAKTNEIGIRMAVGANANDIARLVLGNGVRLALAGILMGAVAASWSTQAVSGMLYKVTPEDPFSFVSAALTLLIVALLASYLPAHRAARLDPTVALRQE